jgi:hypothetical protein
VEGGRSLAFECAFTPADHALVRLKFDEAVRPVALLGGRQSDPKSFMPVIRTFVPTDSKAAAPSGPVPPRLGSFCVAWGSSAQPQPLMLRKSRRFTFMQHTSSARLH